MTDASSSTSANRLAPSRCEHDFLGSQHDRHERRTWWVVWLTAIMMVGEIVGGTLYGSMALVADGWHMSTHAAALTIAALAYRYARQHRNNPSFAFGTGKVGELAGFASAVSLGLVALLIGWESLQRFFEPRAIHFQQAISIAVLGLVVNLISAKLLDHDHGHDHDHEEHEHSHKESEQAGEQHHDTNIRAAYLHVLADAMTSVLAIAGLVAARLLGWVWLDPAIGIVGALVITHWSIGLVRTASASLLDSSANHSLSAEISDRLESNGDSITDLHLWRVGPGHYALIVAIASNQPLSPDHYKGKLQGLSGLSHVTVEVNARTPAAA